MRKRGTKDKDQSIKLIERPIAMYDLFLKGGEVIDPAQNIHRLVDVGLKVCISF